MSQNIKTNYFFQFFFDEGIFKVYTDNLSNILECVLYDLNVVQDERDFALERYYEIIDQLIEERTDSQNTSTFSYMKKNTLLLSAIEDTIKIFIKQIEKNNFTIIKDLESLSFSKYLGNRETIDFKLGTVFTPSNYISNILSRKAKIVFDYYLYSPILNGGKEIRNSTVHGAYLSKYFFNLEYFILINILFFQLIEELTMNYIQEKIKKINLNDFLKDLKNFDYVGKKIKISDFINIYQEYLNKEFQNFIKRNNLTISDYAVIFKVNHFEENNEIEIEIEIFKWLIKKFKINISYEMDN